MALPRSTYLILLFIILLSILAPVRYPLPFVTPVRGIDVSHHQGNIHWDSVADDNVKWAYIKASEGGDFRDSLFQQNWIDAKQSGVVRGAYHFLTFCKPGKEQARNFIDAVGKFDSSELIPAIDIEYGGNCKVRLTQKEMEELIEEFTQELMRVSKNPPVIYMTHEIYQDYFKGREISNRIWARAIVTSVSRKYRGNWDVWQYLHRGRVAGIKGPVDLNVLREKTMDSMLNR